MNFQVPKTKPEFSKLRHNPCVSQYFGPLEGRLYCGGALISRYGWYAYIYIYYIYIYIYQSTAVINPPKYISPLFWTPGVLEGG